METAGNMAKRMISTETATLCSIVQSNMTLELEKGAVLAPQMQPL